MNIQQLREQIKNKAAELSAGSARLKRIAERTDLCQLGDVYILPTETELDDLGIEWVVVRFHVDDANTVLIVPIDQFYLAGAADTRINWMASTARCGQSMWIERSRLAPALRVEEMPIQFVTSIRIGVALLARGQHGPMIDDADPDYQDYNDQLDNLREEIKRKYKYQE